MGFKILAGLSVLMLCLILANGEFQMFSTCQRHEDCKPVNCGPNKTSVCLPPKPPGTGRPHEVNRPPFCVCLCTLNDDCDFCYQKYRVSKCLPNEKFCAPTRFCQFLKSRKTKG